MPRRVKKYAADSGKYANSIRSLQQTLANTPTLYDFLPGVCMGARETPGVSHVRNTEAGRKLEAIDKAAFLRDAQLACLLRPEQTDRMARIPPLAADHPPKERMANVTTCTTGGYEFVSRRFKVLAEARTVISLQTYFTLRATSIAHQRLGDARNHGTFSR